MGILCISRKVKLIKKCLKIKINKTLTFSLTVGKKNTAKHFHAITLKQLLKVRIEYWMSDFFQSFRILDHFALNIFFLKFRRNLNTKLQWQ